MTAVAIRQSGGANIISIPKAIVEALKLHVGDYLDLSLEHNKIVLTPVEAALDLETLLAGSPKACFAVITEDRDWLNIVPLGKEL